MSVAFWTAETPSWSLNELRAVMMFACVVPEDVEYGMGRVFLVQVENLPANYGLFRIREEALQWLGKMPIIGISNPSFRYSARA